MKKEIRLLWLLLYACLFVVGCQNKDHLQAEQLLQEARHLLAEGKYAEAKNKIKSIAEQDSLAFKQIRAGMALLDSIRYAENIRTIVQADSLIAACNHRTEKLKQKFVYQKDKYQEQGVYIPRNLPFAPIPTQMQLRAGVKAGGKLFLESVSNRSLQHNRIKVSCKENGESAYTQPVTDEGANYRFRNGEMQAEVVRYTGERLGEVMAFIARNSDKLLTVTLLGRSSAHFALSRTEAQSLAETYRLSQSFAERDSLIFSKKRSESLLKYLDQRKAAEMQHRAEKDLQDATNRNL